MYLLTVLSLRGRPVTRAGVERSICKNLSKRYDRLSREIYNLFQAPMLRAFFSKKRGYWRLKNIQVISGNDIPPEHHDYVIEFWISLAGIGNRGD